MNWPTEREFDLAYKARQGDSTVSIAQALMAYREELLERIECCLVCRAIDTDANVLTALEGVVKDMRGKDDQGRH